MKISTWSPSHSRVARCCLAALWRAPLAESNRAVVTVLQSEWMHLTAKAPKPLGSSKDKKWSQCLWVGAGRSSWGRKSDGGKIEEKERDRQRERDTHTHFLKSIHIVLDCSRILQYLSRPQIFWNPNSAWLIALSKMQLERMGRLLPVRPRHGAYYRCMVSFIFEDKSRPGGLAARGLGVSPSWSAVETA